MISSELLKVSSDNTEYEKIYDSAMAFSDTKKFYDIIISSVKTDPFFLQYLLKKPLLSINLDVCTMLLQENNNKAVMTLIKNILLREGQTNCHTKPLKVMYINHIDQSGGGSIDINNIAEYVKKTTDVLSLLQVNNNNDFFNNIVMLPFTLTKLSSIVNNDTLNQKTGDIETKIKSIWKNQVCIVTHYFNNHVFNNTLNPEIHSHDKFILYASFLIKHDQTHNIKDFSFEPIQKHPNSQLSLPFEIKKMKKFVFENPENNIHLYNRIMQYINLSDINEKIQFSTYKQKQKRVNNIFTNNTVLYIINKILRFFGQFLAINISMNIYVNKLNQMQFEKSQDPIQLHNMLYMFLAIDAFFQLVIILLVVVVDSTIVDKKEHSIIDYMFFKTIFIEYMLSTFIIWFIFILIGSIMYRKKYFNIDNDYVKTASAFKNIITFSCGIIHFIPFYAIL